MKFRFDFIGLIVLIITLGVAAYLMYQEGLFSDPEAIVNFMGGFEGSSIFLYFILVLVEVIVAPIPGGIIYAIGGALFGTFKGWVVGMIGNVLGAAIAFYIGKKIVMGEDSKKLRDKLAVMLEKYGAYAIFLLRVNPFTSTDFISYLAGFFRMHFSKFIVATTLGLAPFIYIQSYLGGEILKQNTLVYSIFVFASIIYLIIFFYLIIHFGLLRWIKKRHLSN